MKKIFLYAAFVCGLCSCGLDNYDAPTASINGAIIDKETKENVPGQAQNGTKIRMYEFYNNEWAVQPNDSWVAQDGTFKNTAVFTGKYRLLAEGPFETVEPIEIEISGSKQVNFEVTPFLRISAEAVSNETGKVTVKTSVDNVLDKTIQAVEFYYNKTPYVDKNIFSAKESSKLGTETNVGVSTYSHTFENLKSGKTFYFRVGALAVNPGGFYNYSKVIEVTVK